MQSQPPTREFDTIKQAFVRLYGSREYAKLVGTDDPKYIVAVRVFEIEYKRWMVEMAVWKGKS